MVRNELLVHFAFFKSVGLHASRDAKGLEVVALYVSQGFYHHSCNMQCKESNKLLAGHRPLFTDQYIIRLEQSDRIDPILCPFFSSTEAHTRDKSLIMDYTLSN